VGDGEGVRWKGMMVKEGDGEGGGKGEMGGREEELKGVGRERCGGKRWLMRVVPYPGLRYPR